VSFDRENRIRLSAGVVSLSVGTVLLLLKFIAYRLTGSSAILSDALESIINVVAAAFAIGSILFAGRPADRNHPYGHGKIEFFSAAFEGGLISFAAVAIIWASIEALLKGSTVHEIGKGLIITGGAGVVNAILGLFLMRVGKRTNSLILVADGHHVLSDFWTTAGVVIGLILVKLTGVWWIDPLVAIVVALNLARTGFHLVRHAARALLDEEDSDLLQRILDSSEQVRAPGIIRIHHLRAIRIGRFAHVDAHLVVPEFWTVQEAHDHQDLFEKRLLGITSIEGEMLFHTDPCWRLYCEVCDLEACPVRQSAFIRRPALTLDEATQPDPPPGGQLEIPKLQAEVATSSDS
jgi:cation diffusion facilitator family transporter